MTTVFRAAQGSPDYFGLVDQVTSMVTAVVPPSRTVLVVSKGDENLLQLGSRTGWHFPRTDDGRYAGHYPADSDDAVRQLELLRERGAGYLVFPATSLWWLDHYPEFRRHLDEQYACLVMDEDACAIYDLTHAPAAEADASAPARKAAPSPAAGARASQLSAFLDNLLPRNATVAVAGAGEGTVALPDREIRSIRPGDLGALRADGAEFLVIPREAWLAGDDPALLEEINRRHRCIARQSHLCAVYELAQAPGEQRENPAGTENPVRWRDRLPFFRGRNGAERA
jgi:hypothetical protein